MELAIETKQLKKYYGDIHAVDGIDLKIPKGSLFGVLGPNGAGKTTTISISHELKTPLISINSTAEILKDIYKEEMSSKVFNFLEMINEGGKRLENLFNNLIKVYEIESQKLSLEYNSYNIVEILQKCIEQTEYHLLRRKHVLKVDLPDECFIQIDGYQIEEVFINILTNAIKFTPPNGEIFLNLLDNDDFIDILIKDTGIGFTEEEKKKLFTKFGKIERYGQNLDVEIGGVGLGLYISSKIIHLHKGELILKSEGRNRGSIFIIRLYK